VSFYDPRSSNPEMEAELGQETRRELEERAERYSELHPDGPEPTLLTKLAGRMRRLVGRGQ
jgi:hypothetical protein